MFITKLLPQGLGDTEEEAQRAKGLRDEEGRGEMCCLPETV